MSTGVPPHPQRDSGCAPGTAPLHAMQNMAITGRSGFKSFSKPDIIFSELQKLQMAFATRGAAGLQGHTCLLPARGLQHLAPASQAAIYRPLSSRLPALRDAVTCYAAGAKVQPFLQSGRSCISTQRLPNVPTN